MNIVVSFLFKGPSCRLHFRNQCRCPFMVPTEQSQNYTIQFHPKSTQEVKRLRNENEFLKENLGYWGIDEHSSFLVSDGECFALCNIRAVDQNGETIVAVSFICTLEASQKRGHCTDMIGFLGRSLRLNLMLHASSEPMIKVCRHWRMEEHMLPPDEVRKFPMPIYIMPIQ